MKKYVLYGILAALFATLAAPLAYAETFTRYLQKGDRGADVIELQKVLNADADTKITDFGEGAPGSETDFFGEMTKQAVIRLQKKHDLGNKYGFFTIYSGALDDKTRDFLNGSSTPADDQEKLNETFRQSQTNPTQPYIESVSPRSFTDGDTLTITGKNFSTSTDNTIRLTYNAAATTSPDGTTLTFNAHSALQKMFEKQADDLEDDEQDHVKSEIGKVPLFITVQNASGLSNPYQVYFTIK